MVRAVTKCSAAEAPLPCPPSSGSGAVPPAYPNPEPDSEDAGHSGDRGGQVPLGSPTLASKGPAPGTLCPSTRWSPFRPVLHIHE